VEQTKCPIPSPPALRSFVHGYLRFDIRRRGSSPNSLKKVRTGSVLRFLHSFTKRGSTNGFVPPQSLLVWRVGPPAPMAVYRRLNRSPAPPSGAMPRSASHRRLVPFPLARGRGRGGEGPARDLREATQSRALFDLRPNVGLSGPSIYLLATRTRSFFFRIPSVHRRPTGHAIK